MRNRGCASSTALLARVACRLAPGGPDARDRQPMPGGSSTPSSAKQAAYADVAKQIWSFAGGRLPGGEEQRAAAGAARSARASRSRRASPTMPTAFVASYGSGKPVIGIIGEFDALPGPVAGGRARAEARSTAGAPGHGCGHNLLGTASMAAAIAVKDWLASTGRAGHGALLRHAGRGRRRRQGLHGARRPVQRRRRGRHLAPGRRATTASASTNLANISAASSASTASPRTPPPRPSRGRSALDAVEAMDTW